MIELKDALRRLILTNSDITDDLATWEFTTGISTPAVFTSRVIPEGCAYPAIIIDEASASNWGCRDKKGGDFAGRIRVYDDKDSSGVTLSLISKRVWLLVDRANLDSYLIPDGFNCGGVWADPPAALEDQEGFPGYIVNVRALLLEA